MLKKRLAENGRTMQEPKDATDASSTAMLDQLNCTR